MNKHRIIVSVTLILMSAAMLFVNGCNTWRGAGKDVEKTGEKMQDK